MRVKRKRWVLLISGALLFSIAAFFLWAVNEPAPKEKITFLGYTNMGNTEMALFAIWDHGSIERVATVYTETGIGGGWSFDNRSNLQAVLRASGKTFNEYPRHTPVWIGSRQDIPDRSLIAVPVSAAPAKWRLVVQYRPVSSKWRAAREKTAGFLAQHGAARLAQWIQPRPERFYGPEMGDRPSQ